MDREKIKIFIQTAEADLAQARGSLLILAQSGDVSDLGPTRGAVARLKDSAFENEQHAISLRAAECEGALEQLSTSNEAYKVLDMIAGLEASLLDIPLHSDEFLSDVSDFVDASFDEILPQANSSDEIFSEFEIDEETLEVFKSEADELLANIENGLRTLTLSPADQNALWEIRRSSHTLKGAAGIVGLVAASETAHRMEDLLDKLVELKRAAPPEILCFLETSARKINSIVEAKAFDNDDDLEPQYLAAMNSFCSVGESSQPPDTQNSTAESATGERPIHKPIVRVSLERLDELIELSHEMMNNRESTAEVITCLLDGSSNEKETIAQLEKLFENAYRLNGELHEKLQSIRMVKFGTLETRLSRAVNMTCTDVGKKAVFELENGDVEIDTLVIDAIVEPLLHLLKNAVVHGIETPETRRLIGKNERGTVRIKVETADGYLQISVADDGAGVSVKKLKDKAIANAIIDAEKAGSMSDEETFSLMFDRGLSTADSIDLNAGRGVGMSIVKESVESNGGQVVVESELQRGTKFTLLLPIDNMLPKAEPTLFAQPALNEEIPTILVIDDSASMRLHNQKLVESAGFRCITANNGAEALELLLNGDFEPDLILSDVEMPQIDGWAFLKYLKTDDNLGHIPVVLVTSLASDEHRMRSLDLGATDYIVKPLTSDALINITEKHLTAVIA